jgi:Flp pilus assembly protein CpaB
VPVPKAELKALTTSSRRLLARYRRVLAALLAALGAVLMLNTLAPRAAAGRPVVVAVSDLDAGSLLSSHDVKVVDMPPDLVPGGASASLAPLVNRTLAGPVRAGEVITDERLVGPALIAAYPRGTVAAPIRLHDAGVVNLLQTGDRVDVFAATSDVAQARLVVHDAPVLSLPSGGVPGEDAGFAQQDGGLVVLAVSARQAAALAGASATAPLSIAVLR